MFGIFLTSLGTLFDEVSATIAKTELAQRKENLYAIGFLAFFWSCLWFVGLVILGHDFAIHKDSIVFLGVRVVAEIVLVHAAIHALVKSDRSTYSFVRSGVIPLLLVIDLFLGYTVSTQQLVGIGLIVATVLFVWHSKNVKKSGMHYVVISSLLPILTITLYKYNITHYNSIISEQVVSYTVLTLYFALRILWQGHNPLRLLFHKVFFIQSITQALGSILESFAFAYAPASIIITAKRSSSTIWSVVFGHRYFHEHHLVTKLLIALCLILGIVLLI